MTIVILIILLIIQIINIVKTIIIGSSYSIWKAIRYGDDYKKWYKYKCTYIPRHKREEFKKTNHK